MWISFSSTVIMGCIDVLFFWYGDNFVGFGDVVGGGVGVLCEDGLAGVGSEDEAEGGEGVGGF